MFGTNQPPTLEDALKAMLLQQKLAQSTVAPPMIARRPQPETFNAVPMDNPKAASSFTRPQPQQTSPITGRPQSSPSSVAVQQYLGNPLANMFAITRRSESGNRETDSRGRRITSPAGAQGIMQVMPGTQRDPGFGIRPSNGTPQDDARVGEDYLSKMMERYGNDPKKAWAAYNAGPGRLDAVVARHGENWLNKMPAETRGYVEKNITALAGPDAAMGMPQFANPFDPSVFQPAMNAINQAEKAALTPTTMTTDMPDAPTMPELAAAPKRDFTDSDAALARLKPQELDQVQQSRIKRANLFQGIAQGLARIPDGAGLGMVLAQLGAGALAGRAAGDSELAARQDAFDEKMAQYNVALFQNEKDKSATHYQEASQEYNATYQHNMAKFNVQMQMYNRNNPLPRIEGTNMIVTKEDGKGGITSSIIPIEPMVKAASALQRASLYQNIGQAANQGNAMEAQYTNQIIANSFAQQAAQTANATGTGQFEALAASAGVQGFTLATSGMLEQVIADPEQYTSVVDAAKKKAMEMGVMPGSAEYGETVQQLLGNFATQALLTDEGFRKRAAGMQPILMNIDANKRYQDASRTTRVKSGNTTTTVKE